MIRSFNGKTPKIAPSAYVSEAAYIIGDVEIGEHSSVWPGAVIRGDETSIKIGSNTSVQDGTVIHANEGEPMKIGDNVIIGHACVVHGLKIGNNCLVGNNATINHFVEVGNWCLIGANAMVPPNTKVPDRSLVLGVPAKIFALRPEHEELIVDSLRRYRHLVQKYKASGI